MAQLSYVETVGGPFLPNGADIHDLTLIDNGSGLTLDVFAGDNATARLMTFDISTTAAFQAQTPMGAGYDGFDSADYGSGTLYLSASRVDQVVLESAGQAGEARHLTSMNSGAQNDAVAAIGVDTGSVTYLVSSRPDAPGLQTFAVQPDGSLTPVSPAPDPAVGHISDLATFSAYGQTWVLATAHDNDAINSYTLDGNGVLTHQTSFGAVDGLGINSPVALSPFTLAGQPHVVMASSDTSSLSVLRLEPDGSFSAVDHVLDDLDTRFANASLVETFQNGETTYVLASGSDDGFSLFTVRPDGMLHHLATVEDTAATTLNNVSAAVMAQDGTDLRLFIASATEAGLTHFSLDHSGKGMDITGTSGNDSLSGTALDDILLGGAGDDVLDGGAGDDLIVDGAGSDTLIGGAGRDIFTFEADGADDTILDFERGQDALDLSFYPLLYQTGSLGYTATAFGARLTFQGESIDIHSSDGNSLTLAEISATNPFNVNRPALVLSNPSGAGDPQVQLGTSADDNLVGTVGDDILSGNKGDDVLIGGAGGDQMFGGSGHDTVSYATATGAITLDLDNATANSGDAAGDTFASIETFRGTGFDDTFNGSAANDHFMGENGADILHGHDGDDRLEGGTGDDILIGGSGADALFGGAQTDIASYINASQGLRLDLIHQNRNTGEGTGDTYDQIEGLTGSGLDDRIYGDHADNTLNGDAGDDWLSGRMGNDTLLGGAGNDTLDGGAGADLLDGGAGRDMVSYFLAKQGLTAHLGNSLANTGEASGDTYVMVEDLAGSRFDDILIGDGSDNRLIGNSGHDRLNGGNGNDTLTGGSGDDRLVGGNGDDVMSGGSGADTFVFSNNFGHDRLTDFDPAMDLIALDSALLGTTAANSAEVLANHATSIASGLLLDFGTGDTILIDHITDPSLLDGAFSFF